MLSASWETSKSSRTRAPSPMSRASSPAFKSAETATLTAWKNARDTYRKSLSEKDLKLIMVPAGPEDMLDEIDKWQRRQSVSRYTKVAKEIQAGITRIQRFSNSIDIIAQGSPSPACLLWGSIKFVLTIVQDATEEYDKLCKVLSHMVECLPRIELYTETFLDSDLALEFVRVIWNDFEMEFGNLEAEMSKMRDRVESAALAEHIGQSKIARVQQAFVNLDLLDAHTSAREKEIIAWLAPAAYDVNYYTNDLISARALRHPRTCQWILLKDEITRLSNSSSMGPQHHPNEESLLWIYARPGAGKTVLSSRLIDHFDSDNMAPSLPVFYFFCKNTDTDKNTSTAVMRSLLYQLYKSTKDQGMHQSLKDDLGLALDQSGQRKAVNFATMWQLFSTHIKQCSATLIILDALDECQDLDPLIRGLKLISTLSIIKIIVTSRKESHLDKHLINNVSLEITPEDINADIDAFIQAKVSASPQLSHSLVRDQVFSRLSNAHSGMFLWVHLMLKELKTCFSVAQVQRALVELPKGLDGIYKGILQRLRDTLSTPTLDLCSKVLVWVVSTTRPLRIDELKQALTLHYEVNGETLLSEGQYFPYSDRDLELVCGSLVAVRDGTLQVIHLSVKEYLSTSYEPGTSPYSDLLVDPGNASLQLTLVCLKCVRISCVEPLLKLDSETQRIDLKLEPGVLFERGLRNPLTEYASFSWLVHLMACEEKHLLKIARAFQETYDSQSTFIWAEICMAFQPDSVLRLLVGLDEVIDWISNSRHDRLLHEDSACLFFARWCVAMQGLYQEYGAILAQHPWEIHLLDLQDIFRELAGLYHICGNAALRDVTLRLGQYKSPHPLQIKPPPHCQLQQDVQARPIWNTQIFFVHDEERKLYFWGDQMVNFNHLSLHVQNAITAQRLPPAIGVCGEADQAGSLASYAMSQDGMFIAAVYSIYLKNKTFMDERQLTVIWQIDKQLDFRRRMSCEPWARIIFSDYSKSGLSLDSERSVVFGDDCHCLTPSGKIYLEPGVSQPFQEELHPNLGSLSEKVISSFYSGSGKYLFISNFSDGYECQAIRTTPIEFTPPVYCLWKERKRRIADVSHTGRYLVLSALLHESGEVSLFLYDVELDKTIELPFPERFHYWDAKYSFSRDEKQLIAFIPSVISGIHNINVMVWNDFGTEPELNNHGKLKLDSLICSKQIYMNKDETSALMVSGTRTVQRIELGAKITFPDAVDMLDNYPCHFAFVSKDGAHLASLSYGQYKGQLQLIDLTPENVPIRRLDLNWSPCSDPQFLTLGISSDLRVLVVDTEVFNIAEADDSLASTPFTIIGLPELIEHHRTGARSSHWCQLRCHVSPCSSYVVYVREGDRWAQEKYPTCIFLFRIDVVSRSSNRLNLQLPEDLVFASADLHPSLPLMVLSYASASNVDSLWVGEGPPPLLQYFFIMDLESLDMKPIDMPVEPIFMQCIQKVWSSFQLQPHVLFSDCGTFVFIQAQGLGHTWYQVILQLNVEPHPTRFIRHSQDSYFHYCIAGKDNSFIDVENTDSPFARLRYTKPATQGFWNSEEDPPIYLENIAAYPSSTTNADRFLLLGANDNEEMRSLILPLDGRVPKITPLSLTFAQAKIRLERKWELQYALKEEKEKKNAVVRDELNEIDN